MSRPENSEKKPRRNNTKDGVTYTVKLAMEKDAILETLDRQVRVELKVATCEEAFWKREKGTEMKDLKRKEDKVVMRI